VKNSTSTHSFIFPDGTTVNLEELPPSAVPDLSFDAVNTLKWNWISFGATLAKLMSGSALWEG
jgi:hypothetical protein